MYMTALFQSTDNMHHEHHCPGVSNYSLINMAYSSIINVLAALEIHCWEIQLVFNIHYELCTLLIDIYCAFTVIIKETHPLSEIIIQT